MDTGDRQENEKQDIQRLERLTHRLGERIEEALGELRQHVVKVKIKTKQLGYDPHTAKLQREQMEEWEQPTIREGEIDVDNLRKIASALKDWASLYSGEERDRREEELQRVLAQLEGRPWLEEEE